MKRSLPVRLLGLALVMIGLSGVLLMRGMYNAEEWAISCIAQPAEGIEVLQEDGLLIFEPEMIKAGLVFYPGGNVSAESYAPLLHALAERGILAVLARMPADLAILHTDAAKDIPARYEQIETWYICGHSLGGYAAAEYMEKAHEAYEGLILLAGYSTADLTQTNLRVLSVYGSEDGVMNRERYNEGLAKLPQGYTEIVIDGGCHAYFGAYGEQKGDGVPTISAQEQIEKTADLIAAFIAQAE